MKDHASLCCAALSVLLSGGCAAEPEPLGYQTQQGVSLQGGLRGGAFRRASFRLGGIVPPGGGAAASATVSASGGALRVRTDGGRSIEGVDLVGAVLLGSVTYYEAASVMPVTAPVRLRIDEAGPHQSLYGRARGEGPSCGGRSGDEQEYVISLSLGPPGDPPSWEPLCAGGEIHTTCPADKAGGRLARRALPVPGEWKVDGYDPGAAERISLSCLDGVVVKCTDWGYKPWGDGRLHQACTRMARADYHAVGASLTLDGTPIEIFDAKGARAPQAAGYFFEAGWRLSDAQSPAVVCLSKRRWSTLPIGGFRPEILPDPRVRPLLARSKFCPDPPLSAKDFAELKDLGAVLFNNSAFIDAGLYRWRGPSGEQLTTTRYSLSSYDPDTGKAESDPPELAQAGFLPAAIDTPADSLPRDRTGFEGTLLRHPLPPSWTLPPRAVPLHTFILGPEERPTDFLTTTLADPDRDYPQLGGAALPKKGYRRLTQPEGYLFAPPQPGTYPPYPDAPVFRGYRTVPLHTWWDPVSGHHLTTADVAFGSGTCKGVPACRPGDRHMSPKPDDPYVFVRLEGYLLCLGCPVGD